MYELVFQFESDPQGDGVAWEWNTSTYRTDITDPDMWLAQVLEDFLDCSTFNKEQVLAHLINNCPTRIPYKGSPEDPFR